MAKLQYVHHPENARHLAARPLSLPDLFEPAPEPVAAAPSDPSFSVDELARSAAVAAATAAREARRAARSSQAQQTAEAIDLIAQELLRTRDARDLALQRLADRLTDLVGAAFRGLAGPYGASIRPDRARAFLLQCLGEIGDAPVVEVLAPPDLLPTAEAAVEQFRASRKSAPAFEVVGDPAMAPARILVRWAEGWAEHDPDSALEELERRVRAAADLLVADERPADSQEPCPTEPTTVPDQGRESSVLPSRADHEEDRP